MRMAVHIHDGHGYIYDNMPLERPYEYEIVIILAHFEIDRLHLHAVPCPQQNVVHTIRHPARRPFAAAATDVAAADDDKEGALKTSSANPSTLFRYCLNSTRLC
jgi:hypothetical protein